METIRKSDIKLNFPYHFYELPRLLQINPDVFKANKDNYLNYLSEFYVFDIDLCKNTITFTEKYRDYVPLTSHGVRHIFQVYEFIRNCILDNAFKYPYQNSQVIVKYLLQEPELYELFSEDAPLSALDRYANYVLETQIPGYPYLAYWAEEIDSYIPSREATIEYGDRLYQTFLSELQKGISYDKIRQLEIAAGQKIKEELSKKYGKELVFVKYIRGNPPY